MKNLNSLGFLVGSLLLIYPKVTGVRDIAKDNYNIDEIDDVDNRLWNSYRRRPTYLILASRIIRSSSIYQICVNLYADAEPMRVKASLSRDGVEVSGSDELLSSLEAKSILLQVPEGNSQKYSYKLRVEGFSQDSAALLFQNETHLEFTNRFLAIIISTNKVVFTALHTMRVRAVLLRTDLLPYEEVADIFILDPDQFIIRKWHSKQLNNGVLTADFELPEFPKVGFWTIRIVAQGQIEEKKVKVEKYYVPKFETFVSMPAFHFPSESHVEVSVNHEYTFDKLGLGDCIIRWFAKTIDHATPLYNDTIKYREEYEYFYRNQNFYRNSVYDTRSGVPDVTNTSANQSNLYDDPYVNVSGKPYLQKVHNWTYLRTDKFKHTPQDVASDLDFRISMEEIESKMGTLVGVQVLAEAFMTDFFYNSTQRGWSITRIIDPTLDIRFVGQNAQVFKPGMTFETQVSVKHSDQVALDPYTLEQSTLTIETKIRMENGELRSLRTQRIPKKLGNVCTFRDVVHVREYDKLFEDAEVEDIEEHDIFFSDHTEEHSEFCMDMFALEASFKEFRETGVHRIIIDTPKDAEEIQITATYIDDDNTKVTASLPVYAAYAPYQNFIHVRTSTSQIRVGEYVVFHVKMTQVIDHFDWLIISKHIILTRGREFSGSIFSHTYTFSVVVSTEMAPGFHILVYTKTDQDYLITDSRYYPVESINRHKIELSLTQRKDHTMKTVEVTCRGDPGSVFMVSTPRQSMFPNQGGNLLNKAAVLDSLNLFEDKDYHTHRVFWTVREGEAPDSVAYFPSMDYGIDSNRTLELQDLVVFTDFVSIPQTPLTRHCSNTTGLNPCMLTGCFTEDQRCNGVHDCEDGYDESNCGDHSRIKQELNFRYRLSRFSRFDDFYDNEDGEWGWFDTNIDEDHEQFLELEVPETAEEWFFTAFSVSKTYGISILNEVVPFSSYRPIWLYCEGPETVRRGETVGIRCTIFNWIDDDVEVMLNLRGSDDYEFVHVEEFGYVVSYNPRTSKGDHHHFVFIRGDTNLDLHFPIKPLVEWGSITVVVELSTQIVLLTQEIEINIIGEGSVVHRHTSVVLDLKNRANELEFMDIIVDETEIIPYEIFRRYISGSAKGSVTLSGDVLGPTFRDGEPVSLYTAFPTGHGKYGKGAEFHLFNLAANTWLLHYLRLTNQWQDQDSTFISNIFEGMNIELTAVMRRYSTQGSLSMFDTSPPSVWLTAWCLRIFEDVAFQDWEDYIYIDPHIFKSSVLWLINFQHLEGYFTETEYIKVPFLLHMAGSGGKSNSSNHVALTAHVLIALDKATPRLSGHVTKYCSTAKLRAIKFLERSVDHITDVYEMAITAYALAVAGSSESEEAYNELFSMRREEGGMSYWSRTKIATNRVRYEFNRPFLEAKDRQDNDALAVEATGYALLTLFRVDGGGITFMQDQIVKWLNTMRLGVGGFISTVDTIVALEALVRYSYHNNIKDLSNMFVTVEHPDSNLTETFHILREGVSTGIELPLENVWGHVNFKATGAGQSVAQLDITYGIDYPSLVDRPPKKCFELNIKEMFAGRNKSEITYDTCFKWTCLDESPQSGFAMLVLDIPSGYILLQPDAVKIVRSGVIPELRDADMEKAGKTIWFFDYISSKLQCFSHTVRRYFPVANLTRTRQVLLIEPQRPEKFVIRTFNSTSLYILSVCEVCGSYQCPYCPFYSGGGTFVSASNILIFILSIFIKYSS